MARFQIIDETCFYDSVRNVFIPIDDGKSGSAIGRNADWIEFSKSVDVTKDVEVKPEVLIKVPENKRSELEALLSKRLDNLKPKK